ncbi:MAG: bifunctional alpha,alpha-trehalose-phosphate synthase (UDP-forming)/trehalose-phosphatase, partial [Sporomusa sp.]
FKESVGGLVSGFSAYFNSLQDTTFSEKDSVWIGWPGLSVDQADQQAIAERLSKEFSASPVFLDEVTMDKFYLGFCNKTIWPLFHYFFNFTKFENDLWEQYVAVNKVFCDAVCRIARPGDVIWIHDYHLMLLPGMLRERMPDIPIGFFLHIPFPDYEFFRLLPRRWGAAILEGLLGADLVGFHTIDYTQYFLNSVARILGLAHTLGRVGIGERTVRVDTFPMGIDFTKYYETAKQPRVIRESDRLQRLLGDRKIILSVDRLDYTKGIANRLEAFALFLEKYPEWQEKVILALIVVPSRVGVDQYQSMKRNIDETVGRINGRFGTLRWVPVVYQYRYLPLAPLVALYSASDVALITPLRDGMNLVAKEYVAAKADNLGVLILSEMAGAAKELDQAIMVNPNSIEEIADTIKEALEMPEDEQRRRSKIMQSLLAKYDVINWADLFIRQLLGMREMERKAAAKIVAGQLRNSIVSDFNKAQSRLILLDYDGTLVPFVNEPLMAAPADCLLKTLEELVSDEQNDVVIVSGRGKDILHQWLGHLPLHMIAEHGAWSKKKNGDWEQTINMPPDWRLQVLPIFQFYVDLLPGSFIEEKDCSVVWHYRKAEKDIAEFRANELKWELINFTLHTDLQVLEGNKILEVRHKLINKGTAIKAWLDHADYDFILAAGDDKTDEDLFAILPANACSIKIGKGETKAKYIMHSPEDFCGLLEKFTGTDI